MGKPNIKPSSPLKCAALFSTKTNGHLVMTLNDGISEQDLIDNLESMAVKKMSLVQGNNGKFEIYVSLTWKEGQQRLETQRKKPRTWASLDRLVRHINRKYPKVPIIQLELRSTNANANAERTQQPPTTD